MSLAQARKDLGASLKTALGNTWAVFPDARSLDAISKPTLQLMRTKVGRLPEAPRSGWRVSTFELVVIAPSNASDDALEGYVEDVLDALDTLTDIAWDPAERGVWPSAAAATNPAYSITFTRNTNREA